MTKTSFIDRRSARTFRLVRKPAEETAAHSAGGDYPRMVNVLQDVRTGQTLDEAFGDEQADGECGQAPASSKNTKRANEHAGEAAKYGIFFDDRKYDYTKHLRPIGSSPGGVFIPANASGSGHDLPSVKNEAEEEALLNQMTYDRIKMLQDLDPEIRQVLEALDDDEYEVTAEAFEDDFVARLEEESEFEEESVEEDDSSFVGDGEMEDVDIIGIDDDETEERLQRSEKLQLLDDQFDEVMKAYADTDQDAEEESPDDRILPTDRRIIHRAIQASAEAVYSSPNPIEQIDEIRAALKSSKCPINLDATYSDSADEIVEICDDDDGYNGKGGRGYDCETFVTVHTNTENHPALLDARPAAQKTQPLIRLDRHGFPVVHKPNQLATGDEKDAREKQDNVPAENLGRPRDPNETSEERKSRKATIKEQRRGRRAEKKQNKLSFKPDASRAGIPSPVCMVPLN